MEKEHYENIIALLKETLNYYSNENLYKQRADSNPSLYKINLDNGEYARNTLKLVDELEKSNESFEHDYEKLINEANEKNPDSQANEIINKLKNLKND